MKIAYVINMPCVEGSGVTIKILDQLRSWRNFGHDVGVYWLSDTPPLSLPQINFYGAKPHSSEGRVGFLDRMSASWRLWSELYESEADIIYLRLDYYKPWMRRVLRRYPTILEINGNYQQNLLNNFKSAREFGALMRRHYLRFTGNLMLKRSAGVVSVSSGLVNSNGWNPRLIRHHEIIANSIDLSSYPLPVPWVDDGDARPIVAAVFGARNRYNGLDLLMRFAHTVTQELRFNIVSPRIEGLDIPENVCWRENLTFQECRRVLDESDVGVGPLRCFDGGLDSASPLKVRHYLAAGLPLVLSYSDAAFDGEPPSWLLQLPNDLDALMVNRERVIEFCRRLRGRRLTREEVAPYVDTRALEARRLAFFSRVLSQWETNR